MKHDVICAWLGLVPHHWPPDHYSLLGLEPGEPDVVRIEQRVHERLARLRCYQISHPEQATEAMNLLAQAFVCLTDATAKKNYDTVLLGGRAAKTAAAQHTPAPRTLSTTAPAPAARKPTTGLGRKPVTPMPSAMADTAVGAAPVTHVDWKATVAPPPVRLPAPSAPEAASPSPLPETPGDALPQASPEEPAPPVPGERKDETAIPGLPPVPAPPPQVEPAPSGPLAGYRGFSPALLRRLTSRRGLGTRQALYERIRATRRLLHAWDRAGKYLGKAKRALKRTEEKDLSRAMAAIGQHLEGFPRMLGQPGQPGFRVAARARLPFDPAWFHGLDTSHRELLAMDWVAGRTLLSSHRQFLRQELRSLHGRNGLQLAYRAFVNDYPARTLLVLAAVGVALIVYLAVGL